jgi:hypothetical protein
MKLCVGAASRRVVEEAAKLQVEQIVASRRQVGEFTPGYTGYTSKTLVEAVKKLSGGVTDVVRDHGGPCQNGDPDDNWLNALDADVDAGFDVLHLDVCQLPRENQTAELARLCERYGGRIAIEIGGERDSQGWLYTLLDIALKLCQPVAAVAALGGHIWADRQYGHLIGVVQAEKTARVYESYRVAVKAHNLDWLGGRQDYDLAGFYNVAPEFANVEVDAWLRVLPHDDGVQILEFAYWTGAWKRWFTGGQGTGFEQARAALRYHLETPKVAAVLAPYDDQHVREVISDAIAHG